MNINMTAFHNQARFMQDVHQGEKIIAQSDKELAAKPVETCEFEPGDMITSTGTGTVIRGQFGLVVDKELIGKYWRVKVRWGVDQRKNLMKLMNVFKILQCSAKDMFNPRMNLKEN